MKKVGFISAIGLGVILSCGGSADREQDQFRVVMVTDVGGVGDKGFNDSGWAGIQRAVKELGVKADMIQSREQADYAQNLSLAARNAEVVVAMGFLMIDAVKKAAPLQPDTKFVLVDGAIDAPNVASYDFKAQEGAFLAGLLAASVTKTGIVGAVLGMEIPPVRAYESGFRAGISTFSRQRGKEVGYIAVTAGDFNDPVKGKFLARALMAKGADVILQLSGNTGVGVIEAVKEASAETYAIGADIDQDDLVPGRVLVSVLKRIDQVVFDAIRTAKEGGFQAGHRWVGIAEGASGLSEMRHTKNLVPSDALVMALKAESLIRGGGLTIPSRIEDLGAFLAPQL